MMSIKQIFKKIRLNKKTVFTIFISSLIFFCGFVLGVWMGVRQAKNSVPLQNPQSDSSNLLPSASQKLTPSITEETYTVGPGDTLYGISLKLNVSMEELAKLNGITDPNQIKIGQVLKVPGTTVVNQEIEIDLVRMQEIQNLVDQGNQPWRLDPVEVVKVDTPANYQFSAEDEYQLISKDENIGKAVVEVKKTDSQRLYEVILIKPIIKGPKGIWAILSIKETTKRKQ